MQFSPRNINQYTTQVSIQDDERSPSSNVTNITMQSNMVILMQQIHAAADESDLTRQWSSTAGAPSPGGGGF